MESDNKKFVLPPPIFKSIKAKLPSPHFASPEGMLMTREKQPPPMFGPKGTTIPAKYLEKYKTHIEKYNQKFKEKYNDGNNSLHQNLWCESCDSSFKNETLINKHKLEHTICTIDGCSFQGCSKSVMKHITELHSTGMYDKIKNLNTPEDIAKWREERKKRYPTVANVLLRQKVQEEKRKRGELLGNNKARFGSKTDRKKINNGVKNEFKRKNNAEFAQHKNKTKIEKQNYSNNKSTNNDKNLIPSIISPKLQGLCDEDNNISSNVLPKFEGTSKIPNYIKAAPEEKVHNVLTGFLGMYGESSDTDPNSSDSENDVPHKKVKYTINSSTKNNLIEFKKHEVKSSNEEHGRNFEIQNLSNTNDNACSNPTFTINNIDENPEKSSYNSLDLQETSDDDAPDEKPILRTESSLLKTLSTQTKIKPKSVQTNQINEKKLIKMENRPNIFRKERNIRSKVRRIGSLLDYSKLRKTPQNTLLGKLLEPQIRHERNVLLQCIRYVVNNNFFGIGEIRNVGILNNDKSSN